jgi:thiamine biosynthesis lipoprotein ApbE
LRLPPPFFAGRYLEVLHLQGKSVATSGDYLQYFTADKRFHHILKRQAPQDREVTGADQCRYYRGTYLSYTSWVPYRSNVYYASALYRIVVIVP